MKRHLNPAFLFGLGALFWLLCSVIGFFFHSTLDIAVHDMYFVVGGGMQYWLPAIFYFFIAMIYFLFDRLKRPLNKTLGQIHFFGIITAVLLSVFSFKFLEGRFCGDFLETLRRARAFNIMLLCAVVILTGTKLAFLVNIVVAIVRKKT